MDYFGTDRVHVTRKHQGYEAVLHVSDLLAASSR